MHQRRPQQNLHNQQRYPDRPIRINPNDMSSHQHQDSVPQTPTPGQDQQLYVDLPPENVSTKCDSVPLTPTPYQDQQLYVDLPPENVSTKCETTSIQDQPFSVDLPSKNVETSPIQSRHSTDETTNTQTSIADIANGNIENVNAEDPNATFVDLTGLIKVPNK